MIWILHCNKPGPKFGFALHHLRLCHTIKVKLFPFVKTYAPCSPLELCTFFPFMTRYILMIYYSNSWTTIPSYRHTSLYLLHVFAVCFLSPACYLGHGFLQKDFAGHPCFHPHCLIARYQ